MAVTPLRFAQRVQERQAIAHASMTAEEFDLYRLGAEPASDVAGGDCHGARQDISAPARCR